MLTNLLQVLFIRRECLNVVGKARICCRNLNTTRGSVFNFEPDFEDKLLDDEKFADDVRANTKSRKSIGNIDKVMELYSALKDNSVVNKDTIRKELNRELMKLPNKSHPDLISYGMEPKIMEVVGNKLDYAFQPKQLHQLTKDLHTKHIGMFTGQRSYYLTDFLSNLEDALVKFTLNFLLRKHNFKLVSVPDLLPSELIARCGMNVDGERTQIYRLNKHHYGDVCLSGTSEMALAGLVAGEVIKEELPLKMTAVSRCYRAEVSSVQEEKGIFRVHQFTKVEMFGVTKNSCEDSEGLLQEFVSIQKELFSSLGLHFKVLDMPLHELGASAYRKFDIEAWLPGREIYGEISSASNCTDYQSRRLAIRYPVTEDDAQTLHHVHTVNGTACAVPRMIIALLETCQKEDGTFEIPDVLKPYFLNGFCDGQQPKRKVSTKFFKDLPKIVVE